MKHLFLIFALIFCAVSVCSASADVGGSAYETAVVQSDSGGGSGAIIQDVNTVFDGFSGAFETFFALVAFIPLAVQFLRKWLLPDIAGLPAQIFSWVIGIIITLAGWLLNLGFLDGLSIWLALLYGAGACLAANGVFDTGLVTFIFGLFGKKVPAK